MRTTKKMIAGLLALALVLSLSAVAFAAGNGEIKVTDAKVGQEYELYRVFDLIGSDPDANGKFQTLSYTIAPKWATFFATAPGSNYIKDAVPTGKDWSGITVNGEAKYIAIDDSNVAQFALDALSNIKNVANDGRQTAAGSTVTFSDLDLGYYLVYPVGATDDVGTYTSIASLTSTMPKAEVVTKATPPTITKDVNDHHVEVGQVVTFTVTGTVPNTTGFDYYTYEVSDSVTAGLTFTEAIANLTLKIGGYTENFNQADGNNNTKQKVSSVEWTAASATAKAGFKFTIDMTEFQNKVGETVEITYQAKVNADAIENGGENKVKLTYSNDPSDLTKTKEHEDEEKVHTTKIIIEKVDGDNNTKKLEGAEFVLYKNVTDNSDPANPVTVKKYYQWDATNEAVLWVDSEAAATKAVTNASGISDTFKGLPEGEYYLHEVKAPAGYNLLSTDTKVTIAEDEESKTVVAPVEVTVENNSGTELPKTGGVGTTIFYVLGGMLLLGAVVVLVTRKRINATEK